MKYLNAATPLMSSRIKIVHNLEVTMFYVFLLKIIFGLSNRYKMWCNALTAL